MPALSTSRNYLTTVLKGASSTAGQDPGSNMVTANAQAKLNIEVQNHWVNILEALGLQGGGSDGGFAGLARGAASAAQIFSGNTFLPSIFTSHVWRGSTGVQISLPMRFDAWDDAVTDVLQPCQKLIQMFLPSRGGGSADGVLQSVLNSAGIGSVGSTILHPPGPTTVEYLAGNKSNMFTVMLGTRLVITDLIPTTIAWEFEERFDANGNAVAAMITVGFITFVVPTGADVLAWFTNNALGTS